MSRATQELVVVTVVNCNRPVKDGDRPMLQGLSPKLTIYFERAAAARRLADAAPDPSQHHSFSVLAQSWSRLAQSQDFAERLQRFTTEACRQLAAAASPTDGGPDSKVTEAPLISIVDDDVSARGGLAELVQSLGYITAEFARAEQFLRADVVGKTACLISDVQMPGMSGFDLLEPLIAARHPTPVNLVPAFSDEKMRPRALA